MARIGVMRWPRRRVVLAGVVVIAATGIAVNALVLQSARHPAPLFAAVEQARRAAAAAPQKPDRPPLPPARPAPEQAAAPTPTPPSQIPANAPSNSETTSLARLAADAAEKPSRGNDKPRVAAPEKPAPQPAQPARPATQEANAKPAQPKGDLLGEMIRGGIVPPGGIPSEPDPKIMQVQQRLARLGHANVKPDGFMGPATKAAIEKFERDRKWSVTGEVSPRLIRELGTVSASRP